MDKIVGEVTSLTSPDSTVVDGEYTDRGELYRLWACSMTNRRGAFFNLLAMTCNFSLPRNGMGMDTDHRGIYVSDKSVHPLLDIEYWKMHYKGLVEPEAKAEVAQPKNLLTVLAKREQLKIREALKTQEVPIDLFMWMLGKPRFPWLTRYGGLPFRNRAKPWPKCDGKEATFFGQLCFRDSFDLFDFELPGDLLLVFSFERIPYQAEATDADKPIYLEWVKIDEERDPLSSNDTIAKEFEVPELTGVRFRTVDFQVSPHELHRLPLRLSDAGSQWYSLLSLPGTKIGRSYHEVQAGFDPRQWVKEEVADKANLLGTFYSVGGGFILNPDAKKDQSYDFYFGDPGHLVLFDVRNFGPVGYSIYG